MPVASVSVHPESGGNKEFKSVITPASQMNARVPVALVDEPTTWPTPLSASARLLSSPGSAPRSWAAPSDQSTAVVIDSWPDQPAIAPASLIATAVLEVKPS